MFKRIIPFAHDLIKQSLSKEDIAVDMTAGNGHDTLLLAELCDNVYAFDIQETAIKNTKKRLEENGFKHVNLIQDSHANIKNHINKAVKVVIFNLGYLPGESKHITTIFETTLKALNEVIDLLSNNGLISITLYPGHEAGKIECEHIEKWVEKLPSNNYTVLKYQFTNRKDAPYNLMIYKHE